MKKTPPIEGCEVVTTPFRMPFTLPTFEPPVLNKKTTVSPVIETTTVIIPSSPSTPAKGSQSLIYESSINYYLITNSSVFRPCSH